MFILNLIFGAGMLIMFVNIGIFAYGQMSGNIRLLDRSTHWALIGAIVTVVFGFIKRLMARLPEKKEDEITQGGQ